MTFGGARLPRRTLGVTLGVADRVALAPRLADAVGVRLALGVGDPLGDRDTAGVRHALGVRPAQHVTFMVIASPAGAYFKGGIKPVNLWLSETFTRAGRGGMGAAKTGGNYAASLAAQREAIEQGCDQVVFLDDQEFRYIEELGGMNLFFVHKDGSIVTPETGTILEGITRASIVELAGKLGHQVEERRFSIEEWKSGVESGDIVEVFACGTAAVVTPVGELVWDGGSVTSPAGDVGSTIRKHLVDTQFGRTDDTFGWMHRIL